MKIKGLALFALLALLAGCARGVHAQEQPLQSAIVDGAFSDGDYRDAASETPNAAIELSGDTGVISDTARGSSGGTVTITSKGIYRVTGQSENVTIVIRDDNESGNVYLVLDGVTMTNDGSPCIYVEACEKLILQCVGDNSLSCANYDAAIQAKDDVTISGSGTLAIQSEEDGVSCSDDLKITGADISIQAGKAGLRANDSVRVGGGVIRIVSGKDGVHVENSAGDSWFYMESGSLSMEAGGDGVDVSGSGSSFTGGLTVAGGAVDIVCGGGAAQGPDGSASQKGLKCQGNIVLGGAQVSASCADDALNAGGAATILGGSVTLASGDDGIHADGILAISGGEVTVERAYEGLEAAEIRISGGNISVTASDDGVNAGGGSDSESPEQGIWASSENGIISISGGSLYVNAGGDGLDSNGSIYVSGGAVIVEGPQDNGNGALDKGDGRDCVLSVTGGTVLALGSQGMAVNFDSGSQCAALVAVSGHAGDVISVDDGSGFTFIATKDFACAVYSSSSLRQGESYALSAGESQARMDFASGPYYSDVSGAMRR